MSAGGPALSHHHRRRVRTRPGVERGVTIVLVSLLLIPLLVISALVIDVGYAKQRRRDVQSAADASALAAAQELDGGPNQLANAVSAAKSWAAKNVDGLTAGDWAGCSDPTALAVRPDSLSLNTCISFDSLTAPTRVRVTIPVEDQPQFFGQLATDDPLQVTASAVAAVAPGTPSVVAGPCGLCIIGGKTLQITGVEGIDVVGGEIQADRLTANAQESAVIQPLPLKWYDSNGSNWGRNVQPSPATYDSRYSRLPAPVPNPFEALTVDYSGLPISNANLNLPGPTIQPDTIYRQSVNINSGTVTLAPNRTYYFRGNLQLNSGAELVGHGVTLVFVCESMCNGSEGGKFNFSQGSTVEITAPTTGPYAGMAIMFDPTMKSGTPNQLSGNITLEGAVYAKGAGFNMGSSSGIVRAWTIVSGGNFDANNGRIEIDNTKYYSGGTGGSSGGSPGAITLEG